MNPLYQQDQRTVLVVGGSGKTGRRVAERLRAAGRPVRIGSRAAQPAFDWEDRSTWADALHGASAAYITYYPDLAVPGAPEAIDAFVRQALQAGVRRLVLLSGRGEHEAQRAEEVLMASGADWTIVRCSWFMQNFDEGAFLDSILSGEVALPVGEVPEPFVDAEDIADVVFAALSDDRHIGQLYELTGPQMLTFEQAIEGIAQASGRPIAFAQIPMEAFAASAAERGMPPEIVEFLGYLFTEVLDGRNAHLADGVQRALGREPRDFAEYARRSAAAGTWK
ncbi:MAG TPA: NAD(P)H-binding protein [Luteimonas sp.]|nr:NAD(P)H-binding protein [Luteimonas sp.]